MLNIYWSCRLVLYLANLARGHHVPVLGIGVDAQADYVVGVVHVEGLVARLQVGHNGDGGGVVHDGLAILHIEHIVAAVEAAIAVDMAQGQAFVKNVLLLFSFLFET